MILINLFFLYVLTALCGAEDCVSRDYGNDGTVCVCTTAHCDTVPRPEQVEQPNFLKYTSNKEGLRFHLETGTFSQTDASSNTISINPEERYQNVLGWGGAFTDSTGINIASLDEELQGHLLNSYFSDVGIEYSLCRVPIGGTDFSTHGYSYDDGDVDKELKNWQLAPEDYQYKIPYIKKALDLTDGNLRFFASIWTAPTWMKTNGEYAGYGFINDDMYQSWADYFVKFLDSYKKEGIEFWGVTTGNEAYPVDTGDRDVPPINGVKWNATDMIAWISNNLGPTIRNSSHSGINIMSFDDQRLWMFIYLNEIMSDETASQYLDGIAFHWYFNQYIPASLMSSVHEKYPDKFILSTEACNKGATDEEEAVILGSWERGEKYSVDIIEDMLNWVEGWVDWNMVLDLQGGPTYIDNFDDSPIIVNATAGEFYKQPMFYHLGHFSKFVPIDSVRIGSESTAKENVLPVAFTRPDGATVVVIVNKNDEAVPVSIVDNTRGVAEMELSERSITTLLYW